eukprot:CAMPEP_0197052144 /NCGR_PEP_ID=MMETSP1384-20130603/26674_1 /TAXON_ID=29189 /ORGANISM="Ammonia sp." /LENGTH=94 /DNA_ID=CAMNT_0042484805 /DNA_START=106 /DNA_END=390 /DNA_ORIENTATION=+
MVLIAFIIIGLANVKGMESESGMRDGSISRRLLSLSSSNSSSIDEYTSSSDTEYPTASPTTDAPTTAAPTTAAPTTAAPTATPTSPTVAPIGGL